MQANDNLELLRQEMDRQGITDNMLRAGIAAIIGGESGFQPRSEASYRHTDNTRIRGIFKTAFAGKSDSFIERMKVDDETFFNYVYGPDGAGPGLGNIMPDDGYRYRGRGGIQLTGRGNYAKLAGPTGLPLVDDPDLVNDPQNSVTISVAYMRWRYHGGGWNAMKAAVGNSFGPVDDAKNALFAQYQRTGEFAVGARPAIRSSDLAGDAVDVPQPARTPVERLKAIQAILLEGGLYTRSDGSPGALDGDFGPRSRAALDALLQAARQPGL